MSGGTGIDRVIAHTWENFEEKQNKVASGENQEIHRGVLENLVEKSRHTTNTGKTYIATFRGIYNGKQSHGVFIRQGIRYQGMGGERRNNAPYTNESVKYITSPVFHAWKLQVRYSSRGMPGNTSAFEIGFVSEVCSEVQGRRSYRDEARNRSHNPSRKQPVQKS